MDDASTNPDGLEGILDNAGVDPNVDPDNGAEAPEVEVDEDGNPIAPPESEDDNEDVEHDGKTFRAPKGVKEAMLRQADYTKKTQDVADQRRELDEGRKLVVEQAQAHRSMLADVAKVVGLNEQLSSFEKYTQADWDRAHAADPDETNRIWRNFQMLRQQRDTAANALQVKERARVDTEQRNHRQAVEQRDTILSRDIKGWNAETSGKLADFAEREFGITKAEVASITDPRQLKVLHRAMQASDAQKTLAKANNIAKAQTSTPAKTLPGKSTPVVKDQDKMSMEEWTTFERKRMAARAASMR